MTNEMLTAPTSASLATQPDPQPDQGSKPVPERIAVMLEIVQVLLHYGRHMAATIEHRALWRGFATIAQFFGTATIPVILAHIQRGIMRAVALERTLLARAARGRDLVILARRVRSRRSEPPAARAQAVAALPDRSAAAPPQSAEAPSSPAASAPKPAQRPSRGAKEPLTLANLPSMAEIEAEVRRQHPGQTLANIMSDFGIAPTLCEGTFWTQLFLALRCYGGSLNRFLAEKQRREKRFEAEQWRHPNLGWPEATRDGVRKVVGFFIGDPPADPYRPEPITPGLTEWTLEGPAIVATATGPP